MREISGRGPDAKALVASDVCWIVFEMGVLKNLGRPREVHQSVGIPRTNARCGALKEILCSRRSVFSPDTPQRSFLGFCLIIAVAR
jgi:hypothetical protein